MSQLNSNSQSRQRPKPRARELPSSPLDSDDEGHQDRLKQERTVTRSPVKPKPLSSAASFASSSKAANKKGSPDGNDDGSDDDDDAFFNKARKPANKVKAEGKGKGKGSAPAFDFEASAYELENMDASEDGSDDDNEDSYATEKKGIRGVPKRRRYQSTWARVNSSKSKRESSLDRSDLDEEDSSASLSDLEVERDLAIGQRRKGASTNVATSISLSKANKKRTRSPSITPPPEADPQQNLEVERVLSNYFARHSPVPDKHADDLGDTTEAPDFVSQLDPDLQEFAKPSGRARRGSSARRTTSTAQPLSTIDPAQSSTSRPALAPETRTQSTANTQQMHTSRENELAPQPQSAPPVLSRQSPATIEISDSDDETYRPAKRTAAAAVAAATARGARRSQRVINRRGDSSSPVMMEFVSAQEAAARKTQSQSAFMTASTTKTKTSGSTSFTRANALSSSSTTVAESVTTAPEERASEEEKEPVEEEPERFEIVMKGGPQGSLVEHIQVRPTISVKRCLDHFMEKYRADIPLNRTSKVRLRFDGDILKDSDTLESIGIEEGEQLDVIW